MLFDGDLAFLLHGRFYSCISDHIGDFILIEGLADEMVGGVVAVMSNTLLTASTMLMVLMAAMMPMRLVASTMTSSHVVMMGVGHRRCGGRKDFSLFGRGIFGFS